MHYFRPAFVPDFHGSVEPDTIDGRHEPFISLSRALYELCRGAIKLDVTNKLKRRNRNKHEDKIQMIYDALTTTFFNNFTTTVDASTNPNVDALTQTVVINGSTRLSIKRSRTRGTIFPMKIASQNTFVELLAVINNTTMRSKALLVMRGAFVNVHTIVLGSIPAIVLIRLGYHLYITTLSYRIVHPLFLGGGMYAYFYTFSSTLQYTYSGLFAVNALNAQIDATPLRYTTSSTALFVLLPLVVVCYVGCLVHTHYKGKTNLTAMEAQYIKSQQKIRSINRELHKSEKNAKALKLTKALYDFASGIYPAIVCLFAKQSAMGLSNSGVNSGVSNTEEKEVALAQSAYGLFSVKWMLKVLPDDMRAAIESGVKKATQKQLLACPISNQILQGAHVGIFSAENPMFMNAAVLYESITDPERRSEMAADMMEHFMPDTTNSINLGAVVVRDTKAKYARHLASLASNAGGGNQLVEPVDPKLFCGSEREDGELGGRQ